VPALGLDTRSREKKRGSALALSDFAVSEFGLLSDGNSGGYGHGRDDPHEAAAHSEHIAAGIRRAAPITGNSASRKKADSVV
jgi:hypothetical protein